MQTTIKQVGPVEFELEISAKADDLAPALQKALRAQQARTSLKGFRPGKVPLALVKKMYGETLAFDLVDKSIQQAYETHVLEAKEHDVLGRPTVTRLDYKMDGDLEAVVHFSVRPEIDLQDLSQVPVTRLVHEVTDEQVDAEIERLRQDRADLVPLEDEPAGEHDLVAFDLQELDAATRTPIVGKRDEDQALFLDDPRLDESPLLRALGKALQGARAGDTVRFHFEHDEAHGEHDAGHVHFFMASVQDVKRRDLPDLDDEFVEELTGGRVKDVAALRAEIRQQLERAWQQRTREFLENNLVTAMLELHPVPVPSMVVETFLDVHIEDVKRRNEGDLPEDFSEPAFREANRPGAEQQARWMLLRDKIIEQQALRVTDADLTAFFERETGDGERISAEELRRFYQSVPRLQEQLEQRLLNEKVFDFLADRFAVVEKDRETIEREIEARRQQADALAEGQAAVQAAAEAAAQAVAGTRRAPWPSPPADEP